MPILFTLLISLVLLAGLYLPFTHLFWPQIIEGQVGKQNFVGHMIDSWMKGDVFNGFPIRFFADPWHPGPTPWAEEVPLFHWIGAGIGSVTGLNAVHSGRIASFIFALILLYSIRGMAKQLFLIPPPTRAMPVAPEAKSSALAVWLAPALLVWAPGFQIYSASVIPDLAMVSMIALAYWTRLKGPVDRSRPLAYLILGIACLLKYFAAFSVLALFLFDWLQARESRTRWHDRFGALLMSALAGLPTLAYLYYFISNHVPNPITQYMDSNGYGHLAGPFLFQVKFYLRFVTWVFVKNPTIILSICAIAGFILAHEPPKVTSPDRKDYLPQYQKQIILGRSPGWQLMNLHFLTHVLFALIFASSFYVHDYYALPFLLPIVLYATVLLSRLIASMASKKQMGAALIALFIGFGYTLSKDATFRLTNYILAGEKARAAMADIPDRTREGHVIFASDFSLPVIPILTQKSGWAFNAEQFLEQHQDLDARIAAGGIQAFVFYVREPRAETLLALWRDANPVITAMKVVVDEQWPSEGKKGSATRLVVLRP